jgi:hypothetical protein
MVQLLSRKFVIIVAYKGDGYRRFAERVQFSHARPGGSDGDDHPSNAGKIRW